MLYQCWGCPAGWEIQSKRRSEKGLEAALGFAFPSLHPYAVVQTYVLMCPAEICGANTAIRACGSKIRPL